MAIDQDDDSWDDIKDAIESYLDEQANVNAATSHSYLGDQDMIDLDDAGYEDQPALKTATFGDEFAVDSDILVSPHWYGELNLKKPKNVVEKWSEASTKDGRRADHALVMWLEKNGYEYVNQLSGDWPGGQEAEIDVDGLIQHVAKEQEVSTEDVETILYDEFNVSRGQMIYWSSSDGSIDTYAKPKEGEDTDFKPMKKSKVSQLKNKLLR